MEQPTHAERCSRCGVKIRGTVRRTPLGDAVCPTCSDQVNGLIVGAASGGVGGAVAGPGILRWVREALHPEERRARRRAEGFEDLDEN